MRDDATFDVPDGLTEEPPAKLDIGGILARAFRILWTGFGPLFAVVLAVYLPLFAVGALFLAQFANLSAGSPDATSEAVSGAVLTVTLLLTLLFALGGVIAFGAVTYGVFQQLRGQAFGVGAALARGIRRAPALVVVGLAVALLVTLGLLLLIVGALVVGVWTSMALPAAVVERRGLGAIGRSLELTKGHRWEVFAVLLLAALLLQAAAFVLQIAAAVPMLIHPILGVAGLVVYLVASLLTQLYFLIVLVVTYHDLRQVQEGVSTAEITAVFA